MCYGDHQDLHVLTHSVPTRRSSDLPSRSKATSCFMAWKLSGRDYGWFSSNSAIICRATSSQSCGIRISEEHTSELQSLMRISYAVFCLNKKMNLIII